MLATLSRLSAGPYKYDMPMHPRPSAEPRGPDVPSVRVIMSCTVITQPWPRIAVSSGPERPRYDSNAARINPAVCRLGQTVAGLEVRLKADTTEASRAKHLESKCR